MPCILSDFLSSSLEFVHPICLAYSIRLPLITRCGNNNIKQGWQGEKLLQHTMGHVCLAGIYLASNVLTEREAEAYQYRACLFGIFSQALITTTYSSVATAVVLREHGRGNFNFKYNYKVHFML